jgi:pimeloyl-ACP methyl ester carboxylesterase
VTPAPSQLSPHRADRVDLPGRHGPIAALRTPEPFGDTVPVALLLPGYTGSKEDFAPMLDPIADAGIQPVAIDLPGQYESGGPADEQAYLPAELGLVVAELAGKLAADGRPVLLLGHSFGGLVARAAILAQAPVAGLTLMASGPSELPLGPRRRALDIGMMTLREHGVAATQRLIDEMDAVNPAALRLPPAVRELLRQRFLRSTQEALLGMAEGLCTEPDLVGALSRSLRGGGTSCLVVCGENDDAWPVSTQRDMADRLDADFAVVPGSAHSPNTENPQALLATLLPTWRSWLDGAGAAGFVPTGEEKLSG